MNHVKKPMHEDPEKALDYCIYEYLVKKKCFSAAEAFLMEKKIDKETASNTNDDSEPSILDFWEPFHVMYAGYKKVGYERPELAAFFQNKAISPLKK
ncbi:hypothetical protein K502DRAFT_88713 [Neoconidiobolus thromboides FSU 785]|nr:hypothetical protein K502DRAFT_88713 [Neoconidiobolus thromboides FSU 785]